MRKSCLVTLLGIMFLFLIPCSHSLNPLIQRLLANRSNGMLCVEIEKKQEPSDKALTLKECIQKGLKNNPGFRSELMSLNENLEIINQAKSNRRPQLQVQHVQVHVGELASFGGVSIGKKQTDISKLIYQQPLYQFGKIKTGIEVAEKAFTLAETEIQSKKQELIHQIISSYFTILKLHNLLDISQKNIDLIQKHFDVVNTQFLAGVVLKTDVLATQVRLLESRQKQIEVENSLKNAISQFNTLLCSSLENKVNLENYRLEKINSQFRDSLTKTMISNNSEYKKIVGLISLKESQAKLEKYKKYPSLNLQGDYATGNEFNSEQENWSASLVFQATLLENGQYKAKENQIKNQINEYKLKLKEIENQIKLQSSVFFNTLDEIHQKLELTQKIITTAQANSAQMKLQYANGITLNTDVLSADLALFNSRNTLSNLKYDYLLTLSDIYQTAGNIEEFTKILNK